MQPKRYSPEEMRVGLSASFEAEITEKVVMDFAGISGDFNPLHIDSDYASRSNYGRRIVHGAYQLGLASALVGMYLPGERVLLTGVNARFPAPLFFPVRVRVSGTMTAWNLNTQAGKIKVNIGPINSPSITADIAVTFTFHDQNLESRTSALQTFGQTDGAKRKLVLITGASGGIGSVLVDRLTNQFSVIRCSSRQQVLSRKTGIENLRLDFTDEFWEDQLRETIGSRDLYAVIHAAWPSPVKGGLLSAERSAIQEQVEFGTATLTGLARILFDKVDGSGGRLVALGSVAGSIAPAINWGTYSLGKACLENAIRLLAPELARRNISINGVCPSFVHTGINQQANQRQLLIETAAVPMGRLCSGDDVASVIDFLLSQESGFVSGQILGLTGGRL